MSIVPIGLVDGLLATMLTALASHLVGAACGIVLAIPLAFTPVGRHVLQAIGFAIIATPVLISSFLITNALGTNPLVPAALGVLPSLALTVLALADSALMAQRSAPRTLTRSARRPFILLRSLYMPYMLVGVLTALLLSFPATVLYTTIGDMVSASSSPSIGRLIVGTLPSGRVSHLVVLGLFLCAVGGGIWGFYGACRKWTISVLRISDHDIEDRGFTASRSTLDSALVPITAIVIVVVLFAIGSRVVGDRLMIRSPEVALAALGSDYISLSEIAHMTGTMLSKVFLSSTLAAFAGYGLTIALPRLLVPLRTSLLCSALAVQIVPIVVIAAILWLATPELPHRDLIVATLSGLYPAYLIMRERQTSIPKALSDLISVSGANSLRSQWLVRAPWALPALPIVFLTTVPFSVNALLASDYLLHSDGLGRWLYAVNARGEATMVQGMFLLILACSLASSAVLILIKRWADRTIDERILS